MDGTATVSGLLGALVLLGAAAGAGGCGLSGARLALLEENDVFNLGDGLDTDRDYTQGARLAATLPEEDTPAWAKGAAAALPVFGRGAPVHLGVLVGQEIHNPEDRFSRDPPLDDRPYAAWSFAGVALQATVHDGDAARRRDRRDTLELDLGVLGPAAMGELAQNSFHRLLGIPEANGWDRQLGDEPAGLLTWERRWRALAGGPAEAGGIGWDVIPILRARAGTVRVDASAGGIARLGWNLPRDFGPMAVDGHGLRGDAPPRGPWIALQAGGDARGVLHDAFLEGGFFREGRRVTPTDLVWTGSEGIGAGWGPFAAHFVQTRVSPQFRERRRHHRVTSILVTATVWF